MMDGSKCIGPSGLHLGPPERPLAETSSRDHRRGNCVTGYEVRVPVPGRCHRWYQNSQHVRQVKERYPSSTVVQWMHDRLGVHQLNTSTRLLVKRTGWIDQGIDLA